MKLSRYNLIAPLENGGCVIYNALTKNIVELDQSETSRYLSFPDNTEGYTELFDHLVSLNFIVDEDFDELEYFRLQWNRSLYSSGILRHTLLPNLACNCDCPYCFETKTGKFMSSETAQAYLRWLEPQLPTTKFFYMNWFGGEPLLSKNIIREITAKILELQELYRFEYAASIVTNGTLLDRAFVDELSTLKIISIQVTLDGDREIHNKYRFIKKSKLATFDSILDNMSYYCEKNNSNVASIIRVNVTDENYDTIPTLLDRLPDSIRRECTLLFRWVYSHQTGRNPGVEYSQHKKGAAPFRNLAPLYKFAEDKGFDTNSFDEGLNYNFCECDFDRAVQIDPDGDLFMCSHSMQKSESIGNVFTGFGSQKNLSRYARFINANPFDDAECRECKILPICKGGCRKARFIGKKVCSDVGFSIEDYVLQKAHKTSLL